MQRVSHKLYAYENSKLPKKVMKKLNNSLIQKNLKFIEEIEILIDSKINQKSQPSP